MRAQPYDSEYFRGQRDASKHAAEEIVPYLVSLISPRSVLDVGCGAGGWLAVFMEHGIADCCGVDGSYVDDSILWIDRARFVAASLETPVDLHRRFDFALSLEVAEHLPYAAARVFVQILTRHSDIVLFSAAIPGQRGTDHINEQWPEFWQMLFQEKDYVLIDCLRDCFWNNSRIPCCYRQNMVLYVRRSVLESSPKLLQEQTKYRNHVLRLVHPELFTEVLNRPLSLRSTLKALPGAVRTVVRTRSGKLASQLRGRR